MQLSEYGLPRTRLPGCEYPGEWLWATPWTGLRPSYQVSHRCLGSDSSTGHTLVSPNGRPGPEEA
jgi:hypothetical protein